MLDTPDRFDTLKGVAESVVEPLPSSPVKLLPQQTTVVSARNAHAWRLPADMAVIPLVNPNTSIA